MSFYNANPSPEELVEWYQTASQRNAILPNRVRIHKSYATLICGNEECHHEFTRKLLPNRNDPIVVCPSCGYRIYIPVEW